MSYNITRKSNYDGFRDLDKLLENIDSGKLKPPQKAKVEFWCPLCHTTQRNQRLVPSRMIGRPVSQLGVEMHTMFSGRFILCCESCARDLDMARVA